MRAQLDRKVLAIAGAAAALVIGAAVFAYLWMRPEPIPKVSNYVQLTHDGKAKILLGTDGSRLYLGLGRYGTLGAAQMPISGGDPTIIPMPSPSMYPIAVSPDGSRLLLIDLQGGILGRGPLWSLPVLGGAPRRLGETEGIDASWSPDGNTLAYSDRSTLFLANADGSESRKLVGMKSPAVISSPVWSPDGGHFRFNAEESVDSLPNLWEVSVDGTSLHRLLPGWTNPPDYECCGSWTADGKYFVFRSRGQIWALPAKGGFLHSKPKPIKLTSSPLSLMSPLPSKDGKKLFVVGLTLRGELMRYDSKSGQFDPFLGGISVEFLDFSKDGQWVAYVSFPDGALWRSKVDGSEGLQLSYPPGSALLPRWSPDGKKIVFYKAFRGI
jgi:Tol biopolymer transport system component